jgi:hypothetical protein
LCRSPVISHRSNGQCGAYAFLVGWGPVQFEVALENFVRPRGAKYDRRVDVQELASSRLSAIGLREILGADAEPAGQAGTLTTLLVVVRCGEIIVVLVIQRIRAAAGLTYTFRF